MITQRLGFDEVIRKIEREEEQPDLSIYLFFAGAVIGFVVGTAITATVVLSAVL